LSRKKKPKRRKHRRGNIAANSYYDVFPSSGLVKEYERFIRRHVREFCAGYPGLQYELALGWAIERAIAAEARFNPELGNDFSTFLRPYLLRLHRLAQQEQQRLPEIYETKAERDRREAEETGERPNEPMFASGGNGARLTIDHQWLASGSHRRLVIGVQLNSNEEAHARGVTERASLDIKAVLDFPGDDSVIRGRMRAVIDHQVRRQREADQEAENQRAGSHAPVFLATKDMGADVRTYRGRKPPKHHPEYMPMMRLDDAYTHSDEWKGTLHDTIAAGRPVSDAEKQHRLIRDAVASERPFLSKNELTVLDWIEGRLLRTDRRLLIQVARALGITKGAASKIKNRLINKLQAKLKSHWQ
jgi:DNA-directed RNA polymerase specialized sigma subunit